MVRAGRVTGCRSNTPVGLLDEFRVTQVLGAGVAPELLAHALVHALGKGLGEPVGQRFQQYAAVVIVVGLELGDLGIDADTGRDGEGAQVVLNAGVRGRNEVCK